MSLIRPLPSLRQLRYLTAVADTLHFGRAAERCLVTQSTLSAGIAELETLLGVILIERQARRQVVLTPLGQGIVERARALLADAEALVDTAKAGSEPLASDLRLGVIPTVGPYVLPLALSLTRASYPDLRLYLREDQSARVVNDVEAGRLDVALLALPYDIGGLVSMPLWGEDMVVLLPSEHPLASAGPAISLDSLAEGEMLLLEDGHCLRDHALAACGLAAVRAGGGPFNRSREAFQATSLSTLIQMVASGLGMTLVPRPAAQVLADQTAGVVQRDLSSPLVSPARTIVLIWRPGSPRASEFRMFGDLLRQCIPASLPCIPVATRRAL